MIGRTMMIRPILLALAIVSGVALADTPIDETIDADSIDLLDVANLAGSVAIRGTDRNDVHVSGSLADSAERLDVERNGGRLIVHVIYPQDRNRSRNPGGTVLEIEAPRRLALDAATVSASLEIDDIEGEQQLDSVSGSIETSVFESEVRANSVSGRVILHGSDGRTRAKVASVSGRIELESLGGEVDSQNVSGSIEIRSSNLDRVEAQTVSGNITIDGGIAEDGRVRATTTSGSVSLNLAGASAGRYDISTFSGRIDNCFGPSPMRPQFGPPSSTLKFDEADARMQVYVNSLSGNIELCNR
jgi:DUF4097 and DUF4098 domain-containing protein YvlB